MNFRTAARATHPNDNNIAELAASGTDCGAGGVAKELPVTITMAKIRRP
jgi:hypothetical protein